MESKSSPTKTNQRKRRKRKQTEPSSINLAGNPFDQGMCRMHLATSNFKILLPMSARRGGILHAFSASMTQFMIVIRFMTVYESMNVWLYEQINATLF